MRKVKLFSVFVLLGLFGALALGASGTVLAQGPPGHDDIPKCSDMPDAQIPVPGKKPGSACRVPVVLLGVFADPKIESVGLRTLYRSGWTNKWTSESDSDLTEDFIKVEGYLYWWVGGGWSLEDDCEDPNTHSSHAACRTYGGGGGNPLKQDGYHYFHTDGYQDDSFQTQDTWTV